MKIDISKLEKDIREKIDYIGGRFPPTEDIMKREKLIALFELIKKYEVKDKE